MKLLNLLMEIKKPLSRYKGRERKKLTLIFRCAIKIVCVSADETNGRNKTLRLDSCLARNNFLSLIRIARYPAIGKKVSRYVASYLGLTDIERNLE